MWQAGPERAEVASLQHSSLELAKQVMELHKTADRFFGHKWDTLEKAARQEKKRYAGGDAFHRDINGTGSIG